MWSGVRCWRSLGSITPHTEFTAQVYILTKEEGGRHTPFFTNYHPQFYFRTTDVTGTIALPEGTEMVMPGDNTEMKVELGKPIAMEEGLRFAIREGGRTVGCRPRRQDHPVTTSRVGIHNGSDRRSEDPHPAQGVRPRGHRPVDEEDRRDGRAHAGEGPRAGAAADRDPPVLRDPVAARRQGQPRALRDADPQAPDRHRRDHAARRSSRCSGSTCPPASTSRSRSSKRPFLRRWPG